MNNDQRKRQDNTPKKKLSLKDKLLKKWQEIKQFRPQFYQNGFLDSFSYVILIVGIFFMFYDRFRFIGGTIIGIIVGLYFGEFLIKLLKNIHNLVDRIGTVRSLILCGLFAGLFIAAPMIFVGIAIGTIIAALFFI